MADYERITIALDRPRAAVYTELARRLGISRSELVRRALQTFNQLVAAREPEQEVPSGR